MTQQTFPRFGPCPIPALTRWRERHRAGGDDRSHGQCSSVERPSNGYANGRARTSAPARRASSSIAARVSASVALAPPRHAPRAHRPRIGTRLHARRNAEVCGPMRVSARRPKRSPAEHPRGHSHSPECGRDVTDATGVFVSSVLAQGRRVASRGSSRLLRDGRQAHCTWLA